MSLFSIDPYRSAENSPFNIHRPTPPRQPVGAGRPGAGQVAGGGTRAPPAGSGKRVGTLADLGGS